MTGNIDAVARLQAVRDRIRRACAAAGRDAASVRLLAVSKTQPAAALPPLLAAGQHAFGENYVQEALNKMDALAPGAEWHFIGPVQSNKTRALAERFDWVHSVERLKIAERLSAQRPPALPALNVCVQVNISGEASKSGCTLAEAPALCQAIAQLPRLKLRGLMAIPDPARGDAAAPFRTLRALFEQLRREGLDVDTISAGMSDDLEAAIAEGSTLVRVGTALFGPRP